MSPPVWLCEWAAVLAGLALPVVLSQLLLALVLLLLLCRRRKPVVDSGVYRGFYEGTLARYPTEPATEEEKEAARKAAREIAEMAKAGYAFALPGTRDAEGEVQVAD